MSSQSTTRTSSPCGCGGSHGSASKTGCGCGGGCGGAGDCHGGAYVRPRFFAGQLLTEDDLQALGDYVVAKNRLHNRHFFGQGVVCGFEVTCDPCGGGEVVVHPGHALDCCGNDIVLACQKTLDVNVMVRDLRQRLLGGYDCGDPCKETDAAANREVASDRHQYCLYVRYCEDLTDPVSPYATDEPCGAGGCEPTRVREGLRFELRCRDDAKPPETMIDRMLACIGDPEQFARQARFVLSLDRIDQQAKKLQKLKETAALDAEGLTRVIEEAEAAAMAAEGDPTEETVRESVRRGAVLTRRLEQINALPEAQRAEIQGWDEILQRSAKVRERVIGVVEPRVAEAAPSGLEQAFYRAELARWKGVAGADMASSEAREKWTNYELSPTIGETLCELRESLLDRLDASPDLARCDLRRRVRAINLTCPPERKALEEEGWLEPSRQLKEAWLSYFQDCFCRALLPPCPPCDDPAVLLACLEVEECRVVKVCNLERTFVFTPVALRYWLPLDWLGQILEKLCCTDIRLPQESTEVYPRPQQLYPQAFSRLREADVQRLGEAGSALYRLAEDRVPILRSTASASRAYTARPVEAAAKAGPDLETFRKLEKTQNKSAAEVKKLRSELQKQTQRNAALERRLKALEEARQS